MKTKRKSGAAAITVIGDEPEVETLYEIFIEGEHSDEEGMVRSGESGIDFLRSIQTRAEGVNEEVVREYAEVIRQAGSFPFPPIRVVLDKSGMGYIWDGSHRYEAVLRNCESGATLPVLVRHGNWRDAIFLACSANTDHGLRRTREDKHKQAWLAWADNLQKSKKNQLSKKALCEHVKVSRPFFDEVIDDYQKAVELGMVKEENHYHAYHTKKEIYQQLEEKLRQERKQMEQERDPEERDERDPEEREDVWEDNEPEERDEPACDEIEEHDEIEDEPAAKKVLYAHQAIANGEPLLPEAEAEANRLSAEDLSILLAKLFWYVDGIKTDDIAQASGLDMSKIQGSNAMTDFFLAALNQEYERQVFLAVMRILFDLIKENIAE